MSEVAIAGQLLVATPALGDPNFSRAVVLLLDHDGDGSLGVVLNRPTPWMSAIYSRPGISSPPGHRSCSRVVRWRPTAHWRWRPSPGAGEPMGWRQVVGRLGLVDLDAPPELLAAELGAMRIFAGYAGWSPGQLDEEVAEGAWYVVDSEPGDAFSAAPDGLWRAVLRRQRSDLALVSTYPDDPGQN